MKDAWGIYLWRMHTKLYQELIQEALKGGKLATGHLQNEKSLCCIVHIDVYMVNANQEKLLNPMLMMQYAGSKS